MWQTLFIIPSSIAGINVFGVGWLLAIWALVAVVLLARSYRAYGFGPETRGQLPLLAVVAATIAFVLPALVDSSVGGVPIRGYGVMLLASVLSGIVLTLHRARKIGLDPELLLSLATWFFISGIVGARAFFVIEYWPSFEQADARRNAGGDHQPDARRAGRVWLDVGRRRGARRVHLQAPPARPGAGRSDRAGRGAGRGHGAARLLLERLLLRRHHRPALGRPVSSTSPAYIDQISAASCTCMA